MSYVGDAHSVPHGAASPIPEPYEGGEGLWKPEAHDDAALKRRIALANEYRQYLDVRTIHGPALLDGRIPDGWKYTDPIPLDALCYGPDGNLKTHEWYSELLCTCHTEKT